MISNPNKNIRDFQSHFIMLFIFFIIAMFSFLLMRASIITNTQKLGNEIAHYYAMEEEKNFLSYKRFLIRVAIVIDNLDTVSPKNKFQTIQNLFDEFCESSVDDSNIMPYAVIDGQILTTKYIGSYHKDIFKDSPWYEAALDAKGKIILTDVYEDRISKNNTVTMALLINRNKKDVLSLDIFAENYKHPSRSNLLPKGSNFYLFDRAGNIFYYESSLGLSDKDIRKHAENIFDNLHESKFSNLKFTYDPYGKQKFVFHAHTVDGFNIIVTIPYESLLEKLYNLLYITIAVLLLLCFFIGFNIYKTIKVNRHYAKITDTVNYLGNIYYAIFLIDLEKNTYTPIKMPEDTKKNLAPCKTYDDFLEISKGIMEENVSKEFISAFSIKNLHRLSLQGVKEFGGDFKRIFPSGTEWVAVRIFLDYISNTDSAIICFKKVTEEKEAQMKQYELLVTAVENSKKSEEARNKFFANMSHDMRTPLNGIIGFTELGLNHAKTLAETREYLSKIKFSSNHLLELINHILELSRNENIRHIEKQSKINLRETVGLCMQPFFALAKTQHKKFSVEYEFDNIYVFAPTFELTQILNNIVSNAFKYSRKYDSISLKVRLLDKNKNAKFQFIVEDTGKGMTKEFLQKIFIPYQREILFGAKEILGTGLGMPIVKNIVTSLNGEINIDSELNKGTKVTVILPFPLAKEEKTTETAPTNEKLNLENLRILLAEDNNINMEIAYKLLTAQNMLVDKAWNGKEAVSFFAHSTKNFYDLILMDLQMPELDGIGAAKEIRALDREDAAEIPIIALSANAFAEDIAICLQAGMNDHIAKPFIPQKLFEMIYKYTRGKTKNDALPKEQEAEPPK